MKVVLDASAGLAAVLGQPSGSAVLDVLDGASVVIAPELFAAEVTSGLWKYVVAGQLELDVAAERLDVALKLVDRYHSTGPLVQEFFARQLLESVPFVLAQVVAIEAPQLAHRAVTKDDPDYDWAAEQCGEDSDRQ